MIKENNTMYNLKMGMIKTLYVVQKKYENKRVKSRGYVKPIINQ